jgi:hypothetical protein
LTEAAAGPYIEHIMITNRNDPAFWEIRTLERRIRNNELTTKEHEQYFAELPDVSEKGTASRPLEEPIDRSRERRPQVRISATPLPMDDSDESFDDDDFDDDEDEDEDEDDDLADE